MAHVRINRLTKSFGTTVAVADFSLEVGEGEFVALLGPSGCGKTTAMRMIAGITDPDDGELLFDGKRVDHLPPERRDVGLVFQSYALFPHMSVSGNVGFGLRMRGMRGSEVARRIEAALAMVDLEPLGARYPRQLSGGQQQRVALARALAIEPEILLLDEPLSNLDAKLREQLRDELKGLQRRVGTTAIYVTHDQSEAMALADRVVLMSQGQIVEIGTPMELYRRPSKRFTAEFLGHTNILPGRIDGGQIVSPWGAVLGPAPAGATGDIVLSVRPEDMAIASDGSGPGRVTEVSFLGAEIEHKVEVSGLSVRARSSGGGATILPRGTAVTLTTARDVHVIGPAQ